VEEEVPVGIPDAGVDTGSAREPADLDTLQVRPGGLGAVAGVAA
jgi:hypothetical protein